MASRRVVSRALEALQRSAELSPDAIEELRRRFADAPERPPDLIGPETIEDDELDRIAIANAARVASALRELSAERPYTVESIQAALRGLCPIWPFC